MIERPGLRVHGVSNGLWNEDLAAVPPEDRTWKVYKYISLWVALSFCIPTYMLASGLFALGMSWKESLGTVLLGNLIVLVLLLLNGHAGAKYGISSAVYLRSSFGVSGAAVPSLLRALVACGWFGIQCWIGGEALFHGTRILFPSLGDGAIWGCFAVFWLLSMVKAWHGIETTKSPQNVSALIMLLIALSLLFWMLLGRSASLSAVWANADTARAFDGSTPGEPDFWTIFLPSLTGVVGFWGILALSISDFTRYGKPQKAQMVRQALGLPLAMALYSSIALVVAAATSLVEPTQRAIWNPIDLIANCHQPVIAVIGLAAVMLATLNSNIQTNLAGPSIAFENLRPSFISLRMGAAITGLLSVGCMPWELIGSPEQYIHGWLLGSSVLLGPIAGIMIADYFILRERSLNVDELYVRGGAYEYHDGVNRRALVALALGAAAAFIGVFVPRLYWLYDCSFFVGFAVAALVYLTLMSSPNVQAMIPPNPLLLPVDGFEAESPMA